MERRVLTTGVMGLLLLLTVACGGTDPKPTSPTPAASDSAASSAPPPPSSAEAASSAAPAATDPSPPGGATTAQAGGADAGAGGGGNTPKPVTIETKDECTPVGVDFEKRARPKLKECYAEGKKKEPNLEGTVKIKIVVDVKGKIKSTKVVEKTLPDKVADCMLNVIKKTPFPEVDKCWDASLTIPITFPTPR